MKPSGRAQWQLRRLAHSRLARTCEVLGRKLKMIRLAKLLAALWLTSCALAPLANANSFASVDQSGSYTYTTVREEGGRTRIKVRQIDTRKFERIRDRLTARVDRIADRSFARSMRTEDQNGRAGDATNNRV